MRVNKGGICLSFETIAVLGAGHGGHAVAAELSLAGYKVNMYNRWNIELAPIIHAGGIELVGESRRQGFAKLNKVTTNMKEAIDGVELIVVVVPTSAHRFMAKQAAPYLKDGQLIFLNPGHTGGALEFSEVLKELNVKKKVIVAESMSITHASRLFGPAKVRVMRLTKLLFAAIPARDTDEALDRLKAVFPNQLKKATNVLETGFNNINAMEHPPGMLMNAGWIEHTWGGFGFYDEGVSPSVGRVIDAIDAERLKIMQAIGLKATSFVKMFYDAEYTTVKEGTAYEALQASEPNKHVKSPNNLRHRYVVEDVGFGLVPMASIARICDVETPVMDSLIMLASVANETDYWHDGRTVEKMGIAGMSVRELTRFVNEGYVK